MKALIKYLIITILLSTVTASYLLCTTTEGLRYNVELLARFLPGELSIEKVHGKLFSEFTFSNISYRTPDSLTTIKNLRVAWDPTQLLYGKIHIEKLELDNSNINETDSSEDAFQFPDIPRFIIINQLKLQQFFIKTNSLEIKLYGQLTDQWDLHWKIHIPDLKKIDPAIQGSLDSNGSILGSNQAPVVKLVFNGSHFRFNENSIDKIAGQAEIIIKPFEDSSLTLTAYNIKINDHPFKKIQLGVKGNVTLVQNTLQSVLKISIANEPIISAAIALPNFSGLINAKQSIEGKVDFKLTHFQELTRFITNIRNPQGTLKGQLNIKGTFAEPSFTGEMALTQGQFFIPYLGIKPENITLRAIINDNKMTAITGHFKSGNGNATLIGSMDLNQKNLPISFKLQGENLNLVHLAEYKATASPNLDILFAYPKLTIKGNITLPTAEILPKNIGETKTLPDEVVFINQETNDPVFILDTELDIHLLLGEKVNIHYDNLQGMLSGSLKITKNFESPATARGELFTTKGRYAAYGQKLSIDTGRLIYTGNLLTNPGLDIQATKSVRRVLLSSANDFSAQPTPIYAGTETIKVGIQVSGTTNRPKISLFSIPGDLSQGDILSYLILGYPQSHASNSQGSALLGMLTSLQPGGGNITHLTEKLEKTLGLYELNVISIQNFNPTSKKIESTTAFVVGKQFTDRLSLHYSIGLFEPVSILNMRYQINNHWAIQSETSTIDNGADLVYVFERD